MKNKILLLFVLLITNAIPLVNLHSQWDNEREGLMDDSYYESGQYKKDKQKNPIEGIILTGITIGFCYLMYKALTAKQEKYKQ